MQTADTANFLPAFKTVTCMEKKEDVDVDLVSDNGEATNAIRL